MAESSKFWAELDNGKIIEFYNIVFSMDHTMYAWTDEKVIEESIQCFDPDVESRADMFIRTQKVTYMNAHNGDGYVKTGYSRPTKYDIPFYKIRSMWSEEEESS